MSSEPVIFLPGLSRQINMFLEENDLREKKILVCGSNSEKIAGRIYRKSGVTVELIVPDFDSLMNSRILVSDEEQIKVRLMDFEHTDFDDAEFDYIYSQGAFSTSARKGIVKEMKRILKPGGKLCVGEVVILDETLPQFIEDIFDASDLDPLTSAETSKFYESRNFKVLSVKDASDTLRDYYEWNLDKLAEVTGGLSENEKSYYKKLLNRISHESQAFIKQGADRYIGFEILLMEKL